MSKQHEDVANDLVKKQLRELGIGSEPEPVVESVRPFWDKQDDLPFYPDFSKTSQVRTFVPSAAERNAMKSGVPAHQAAKFEFDVPEKWKASISTSMFDEVIYGAFHHMLEDLKAQGLHVKSIFGKTQLKEKIRAALLEHCELRHDKVYTIVLKKGKL
jgi:hypothetical protein